MPDLEYLLDVPIYGFGGIANPADIPDGSLLDANGNLLGVTVDTYSGDHTCLAIVTDHVTDAQSQLISQYSQAVRLKALIAAYVKQEQEFEDAMGEMLTAFQLAYASGVRLDWIGELVGAARGQLSEADFRLFIEAHIIANRSWGLGDQFIEAFRKMIPGVSTTFVIEDGPGYAEFTCTMGGVMFVSTITNLNIYQVLRKIIGAGIAFWYRFTNRDSSQIFKFSSQLAAVDISAARGFGNTAQTTGGHWAGVYGPNSV